MAIFQREVNHALLLLRSIDKSLGRIADALEKQNEEKKNEKNEDVESEVQ